MIRFWLVYETEAGPNCSPDCAWLVAAWTAGDAFRAALNDMVDQAKDNPDWIKPTGSLVVPMTDPFTWGAGPFSIPPDRKYKAEAFTALWNYEDAEIVRPHYLIDGTVGDCFITQPEQPICE